MLLCTGENVQFVSLFTRWCVHLLPVYKQSNWCWFR